MICRSEPFLDYVANDEPANDSSDNICSDLLKDLQHGIHLPPQAWNYRLLRYGIGEIISRRQILFNTKKYSHKRRMSAIIGGEIQNESRPLNFFESEEAL